MKVSHAFLLLAVLLLGVLFAVSAATEFPEEDDVLVLTSENFNQAIAEFPFILVEFYAPWCGHCKSLAPEYARAAAELKAEGFPAKLAKVDATVNQDLASRFQLQGFPTLKLFRNGKASEYTGGRTTETIIEWIKRKSGPAAETISTPEQLEQVKAKSDVSVIAYFTEDSANRANFLAIAAESESITYGIIDKKELIPEGQGDEFIILYKNFDEQKNVYSGDFSAKSIAEFVLLYSIPLVNEFLPNTRVFNSPIRNHFFLFVDNNQKEEALNALREPATEFRGRVLFTIIDISEQSTKRISEYFGITTENVPQAFIFVLSESPVQYKHDSHEINAKSYTEFVQGYLDKTIRPYYKSEEPEEYSGKGVRVLVGKDHDSIAKDETKNVLVEYYAPWCGHCKNLAPIYELLAESFEDNENVVIAKIDSTKNEVEGVHIEGFPTIILYPAGADAAPVRYSGANELEDLRAFVELHGVGVEQQEKKPFDDEL